MSECDDVCDSPLSLSLSLAREACESESVAKLVDLCEQKVRASVVNTSNLTG